jgi:hypothetical protein
VRPHRCIEGRYESFIGPVVHSLRPIRQGLFVIIVFGAELAVEPSLSGVGPVDLRVTLAPVRKPRGECQSRPNRDGPGGSITSMSAMARPTYSCCSRLWKAGATSR